MGVTLNRGEVRTSIATVFFSHPARSKQK